MISYKDAITLYEMFIVESTDFVNKLGLVSIHEMGWWFHSEKKESCLKIVDKHKWLLSKIEHGI